MQDHPQFASLTELSARWGTARSALWKWRQEFSGFPAGYGPEGRGQRFLITEADAWFKSLAERSQQRGAA